MEDLDLLRAAFAVAMADGELQRSEKGVVEGLAKRLGVGRMSADAMRDAAEHDDSIADNIFMGSPKLARSAFELLVALARIDGEVSDQERSVLVRIASSLGIPNDEFASAYRAGIERADAMRKSRSGLK